MMWFGTISRSAPACIVIAAARFDADGFGNSNLYVIDVAAVPDRLENSVGKTKCQNVLDGFFSQVVINAVNLFLADAASEVAGSAPWQIRDRGQTAFQ